MSPKRTLRELLAEYRPIPGSAFYQKMEDAPWKRTKAPITRQPLLQTRLAWQFALGILLVVALLGFSIPSVRASLSAWLGLSVAPSNQMPAEAVTLVAITPATPTLPAAAPLPAPTQVEAVPTETAAPTERQPAEVIQVSAQAGWELLTPNTLPEGYRFQSAYFDTNHRMAILTYLATQPLPGATDPSQTASKTITLLEARKNDFVPMQVAPDAQVEDAQVSGQPAAYVVGAWDTEFVKDDNDPNGGKMVSRWRNDLPIQNLYWQVGEVYLLLITDDSAVSREAMTRVAGSIIGK